MVNCLMTFTTMIYQTSRVYKDVTKDLARYNMLRGGTRSTKSFSLTQMVVRWLMTGKIGKHYVPKGDFFILRESFPALRRTVYKDFKTILSREGFMSYVDYRKSTHEFERQGRIVSFFSADDESKIHGPQSTFFWINEATSVDIDIFNNLNWRCNMFCFLDYNPLDPESWVKEMEEGEVVGLEDVRLDVSTVYDNKHLSEMQMKAILSIKDEELRNVYLKGNWTKLSGLVFPDFQIVDSLPDQYEKRYYSIDFGWVHPFVFLEFRQTDNNVFIHQHVHQSEFNYNDLADVAIELNGVKGCADSADPRSINELRNRGFKIRAVKKPKIVESVRKVREYNLHITKDSVESIKQLKMYKRKKNAAGDYIETPIDINDDTGDAIRYGVTTFSRKSMIKLV
jgi:phage terminase large subunit